ncbi:3-oxoacyl-[acyl-carrier-protein] synthase 2 (plasmid) [Apilactobacillus kunkeei]|uniref:beta-ketoacyl-[acyl-carrier-protein] synthase family protein n=1 Tax=Apilactobacillus waqarii TaxID=2851006 RepID=UPI0021E2B182|nr:3-oxoacyl-[acyl-carrier-protein] synthase 2 [Apilactobacillus kunkeei]CAI2672709.1 3-oxoacyl-[acyl-carrier-protein] synthase 2 [Apilactobacillus kunkeei]CAI2673345.1 3-oxoacyl-[acyl-carrier-protein] synthase 2 [Apilactobacillus kunkeei]CAI2675064.1 3-oxoacyl-[acyl-carrier-protein] synthase 2 [Apilactobacillus kunkeei]CAI2675386.1 3-oxoacyl-[acyl-carrier-protein] synthase 2 [Apilactobacillus kunkeei]
MKRVVITGIGTINPLGNNTEEYWNNLCSNYCGINNISKVKIENDVIKVAGEIKNLNGVNIPKRLLRKIDTFTIYSLIASNEAIYDSKLNLNSEDLYKIGVFVGNNSGGWDISERGFTELYKLGAKYVNPWQATAWFPAAPQGYISIFNGLKGLSKSFVSDKSSGAVAISEAMRSIRHGYNDIVICGGCEAPINKLGITCMAQTGEFFSGNNLNMGTEPFNNHSNGQILSEGSSFLVMEELNHALNRKARIYGEVSSASMTMSNDNCGIDGYKRCVDNSLRKSELSYKDIDLFIPEGNSSFSSDMLESSFIKKYIDDNTKVTVPKSRFGHLYGASTPTDIVTSLLCIKHSTITPVLGNYKTMNDIKMVKNVVHKNINNSLLMSRSREGINVSIILKKFRK